MRDYAENLEIDDMHEVAVMQNVVQTILARMQQAGACRVTEAQLVIGASGHFTEDAARLHFEALTRGTPIEGAELSISWLPASFQCFSCSHRFESYEPSEQVACPRCADMALEIGHKDICFVSAIDVTDSESEHVTSALEGTSPHGTSG